MTNLAADAHAVILVEGVSDQRAVETLAARHGRDLEADGVIVLAMGGAHAIGAFLARLLADDPDVGVAGLCDEHEAPDFRRALERTGFGADLTRADMEALGFFVCVADLEDELIRALGAATVEQIIEGEGELRSFRILQKQPAQQGWTLERQLRRFMGSKGGRKLRYAPLLVDALDLTAVPAPLQGVLDRTAPRARGAGGSL